MKTMRTLLTLFSLLIGLTAIANDSKGKPENSKKKTYNETFSVGTNDLLRTDNRYGNTTITHWNRNEVNIRVEIEAKGRTPEVTQEILDRINITLKKEGNTISAFTEMEPYKTSGLFGSSNRNERFTIHYFIQMPAQLAINLSQKYGDIILPEKNEGESDITVKYGNLKAGSFTRPLDLEAKYSNVTVKNLTQAEMDLGYCGKVEIGNAEQMEIDSKYSNMEIAICKQINIENKYGNIDISEMERGTIDSKYGNIDITTVKTELAIEDLSYGNLSIAQLDANFASIYISARYGNATINIPKEASFKVTAEGMKYGSHSVKGFNNVDNGKSNDEIYYKINNGTKGSIHFDGNGYSNLKVRAL